VRNFCFLFNLKFKNTEKKAGKKSRKLVLHITLYWQNAGRSAELKNPATFAAAIFPFTVFS